jgi:hypothetical protein
MISICMISICMISESSRVELEVDDDDHADDGSMNRDDESIP